MGEPRASIGRVQVACSSAGDAGKDGCRSRSFRPRVRWRLEAAALQPFQVLRRAWRACQIGLLVLIPSGHLVGPIAARDSTSLPSPPLGHGRRRGPAWSSSPPRRHFEFVPPAREPESLGPPVCPPWTASQLASSAFAFLAMPPTLFPPLLASCGLRALQSSHLEATLPPSTSPLPLLPRRQPQDTPPRLFCRKDPSYPLIRPIKEDPEQTPGSTRTPRACSLRREAAS